MQAKFCWRVVESGLVRLPDRIGGLLGGQAGSPGYTAPLDSSKPARRAPTPGSALTGRLRRVGMVVEKPGVVEAMPFQSDLWRHPSLELERHRAACGARQAWTYRIPAPHQYTTSQSARHFAGERSTGSDVDVLLTVISHIVRRTHPRIVDMQNSGARSLPGDRHDIGARLLRAETSDQRWRI